MFAKVSSIRRIAAILALAVSALVVTACGSSNTSSKPSAKAGFPAASESIASYAKRFEAAVATAGCAHLQTFDAKFFASSRCAANLPFVHGAKVTGSASYGGTAGVIDVTSRHDPKGATVIVEVNSHGKWAIIQGVGTGHPTVGTTPKNPNGFLSDLNGTLTALRHRDCPAFIKYAITATNSPSACTQPFASGTARALTADPAAVPTSLGGNKDVQFYALMLKGYSGHPQPTYLQWDVGTTPPGPGVTYPYATDPPNTLGVTG